MVSNVNDKCCNYNENTSPTLDQIKAIETGWNTFVNNFYNTVNAKYSTDLSKIPVPTGTIIRNPDGTSKKNSNGDILFKVMNDDEDPVELCREEINALRLKSILIDTGDDYITHNITLQTDSQKLILARGSEHKALVDMKEDPTDTNKITNIGINSCIAAGKITLRTHLGHYVFGDYVKKELYIDETWMNAQLNP